MLNASSSHFDPTRPRTVHRSNRDNADLKWERSAIVLTTEIISEEHYLISSSAVARSVSGTSMPSGFAVVRLIINSNLVDCTTGRLAGLPPLRMDVAGIDADDRVEVLAGFCSVI